MKEGVDTTTQKNLKVSEISQTQRAKQGRILLMRYQGVGKFTTTEVGGDRSW